MNQKANVLKIAIEKYPQFKLEVIGEWRKINFRKKSYKNYTPVLHEDRIQGIPNEILFKQKSAT